MNRLTSIVLSLTFGSMLFGCSAPTDPSSSPARANDYFFPQDATLHYTYSQDKLTTIDTFTYRVNGSQSYGGYSELIREGQSASANDTLYYFKNDKASDGSQVCVLSSSQSDKGLVVLKGILDLGASWYADGAQNIQATVVGKYADYYLPGRERHYNDVIVVKYVNKLSPPEQYMVRYFARDFGLILERTVLSPSSDIANLQLLSRQSSTNGSQVGNDRDRWYNRNGRYTVNFKLDSEGDK